MDKKSFRETSKWIIADLLVPLVVGFSTIFIAAKANQIAELQALIAKNSEQPTFEISQQHYAQDDYYPEEDRIEISVLDGKYSNCQFNIYTFLVCTFRGYGENFEYLQLNTVEIPISTYYYQRENNNSLYGNIETLHTGIQYERIESLCTDMKYQHDNAIDLEPVSSRVLRIFIQTFLEITYTNLLDETETIYYLLDDSISGPAVRLDSEYGAQQVKKFNKMVANDLYIELSSSSDDVFDIINTINESGNLYKDR